jgi:molybdopterin-guanine dinucleotide biosynthesis protein
MQKKKAYAVSTAHLDTVWRWDLRILLAMNRVTILDYLLAEGYKIVPISKILLTCDYTIDHEGRQCPK